MSAWFWIVLLFALQIYVGTQGLVGKGRVITAPMVAFIIKRTTKKLQRKTERGTATMKDVNRSVRLLHMLFSSPSQFRFWQVVALFTVIPFDEIVINIYPGLFYYSLLALYLDDWLTGDIDKWKRRWQSLKNKIKWKVFVPSPVRSPS